MGKVGPKKLIDSKRFSEITTKILDTPKKSKSKKTAWYQAPFIWIAKIVSSLYLWFQSAFFGRITTKQLLNKIATYCQDANNAPHRIKTIEDEILPEVNKLVSEKAQQKQKILQDKLANGLLEVYKILLALKSEAKRESIMSKAIAFSHVDGMKDLNSSSFYKIVCDCLEPYFKRDFKKGFKLTPCMKFYKTAYKLDEIQLSMEEPEGKLSDAENEYEAALKVAHEKSLKISELTKQQAELIKEEKEHSEHYAQVQENLEKAKAQNAQAEEKASRLKKRTEKYREVLKKLQKEFHENSLDFKKNFQNVANIAHPLLVAKSSPMVKEILLNLYEAAYLAVQLDQQFNETCQQVKEDDSAEAREKVNKIKFQLNQQIEKVNQQFDYSFNLVQSNIDLFSLI